MQFFRLCDAQVILNRDHSRPEHKEGSGFKPQRRYEDDRDEGEWFLYTGSGGRDLSGNKRVTSVQSFDQTFEKMNKALLTSCQKGLPVRVVRSAKARPTLVPLHTICMSCCIVAGLPD